MLYIFKYVFWYYILIFGMVSITIIYFYNKYIKMLKKYKTEIGKDSNKDYLHCKHQKQRRQSRQSPKAKDENSKVNLRRSDQIRNIKEKQDESNKNNQVNNDQINFKKSKI